MSGGNIKWLDERFRDRPDSGAADMDLPAAYNRWRISKLAETIEWAAVKSYWYRHLLKDIDVRTIVAALRASVSQNDGPRKAAAILAGLPFTVQEDLAADSDIFLAVGHSEVEGIISVPTSGTSGPAKRIRSTSGDMEETIAFFQYGMRFLINPGRDRVALAMSPARPGNVGDLLGRALERIGGVPFLAHGFVPEGLTAETRWLEELAAWAPTCLVGVPPQLLALSRHSQAGWLNLKSILLSGDVADDNLVAELEGNFSGCRVFRHYGLTETGLGGAVECGERDWPHLRDDLWVEIVDAEGRVIAEPGESGEIVITPLARRGLPLLRYRTGDEGLIMSAPCPCGSLMPRLKTIGRLSDRLILPGGRILRVNDFEAPLLTLPFVRDYDLRLHSGSPGGLTIILTVTDEVPGNASRIAAETVRAWLGRDLNGLPLSIELADKETSLKASGGKRRLLKTATPPPTDAVILEHL